MNIREAGKDDFDLLASIHAQCFADAWSRDAIAALLDAPGTFTLLADGTGMIMLRIAADEAEILTIGITPGARQSGLGTALVSAGAERAAESGAKTIFLEVDARNMAAKALYEKLGFRRVGERKAYYRPEGDALVLNASLPLTFRLGIRPKTE